MRQEFDTPEILKEIRQNVAKREETLSPTAFRSQDASYFREAGDEDVRSTFSHDVDKILYSRAYARYIDKTQVFYLVENDHITHRVLHVQLVSKIARTIGRFLNLNEDLIEAISLGHDVGHTPFGHNGERIVSQFCQENGCGIFEHNIQSFRLFHEIEKDGTGLNISAQTLDGIICHNGECLKREYRPNRDKLPERLLEEYRASLDGNFDSKLMVPMTLEGCVMRIADIIAYIGKDIEDAVELKLIQPTDVPQEIREVLGEKNRDIVNKLIVDLVNNSYDKSDTLCFSSQVHDALESLKKWNYDNIYNNPLKNTQDKKIEQMFRTVMEACLNDLSTSSDETAIKKGFLPQMPKQYADTPKARIVADYVSGMTDDFLMNTFSELTIPKSFGINFAKHN